MSDLKTGFLSELIDRMHKDKDLDFQIRNNYINMYYKGNSLLKLAETRPHRYKAFVDIKFRPENISYNFTDTEAVHAFIDQIPMIKDKIAIHKRVSLETEYEQLIIRANNLEPRNNTEYFIIDRQYATDKDRFDLTGVVWNRNNRRRDQTVPLCFMEVKFALNRDIGAIHSQLKRYYSTIETKIDDLAQEAQDILKQKIELGLFRQDEGRIEVMKTMSISNRIDDAQFIIILVDYNPYSLRLKKSDLKQLDFSAQIKIIYKGFALWQKENEQE